MSKNGHAILIHETNDNSKDNLTLYVIRMQPINTVDQVIVESHLCTMTKHGIKMSQRVNITSDPYEFLDSKGVKDKLKMTKHNLTYSFERQDIQLVTAYAAAIIVYKNS